MRWRGVLIREGAETVDGRLVERGATAFPNLPAPVVADGLRVGWIDTTWRDSDDVWVEGSATGVPEGWRPHADLDQAVFEWIDPLMVISNCDLRAATFTDTPGAWPDLPFEVVEA